MLTAKAYRVPSDDAHRAKRILMRSVKLPGLIRVIRVRLDDLDCLIAGLPYPSHDRQKAPTMLPTHRATRPI